MELLTPKTQALKPLKKHEKDICCIHHINLFKYIRKHGSMCDVQNDG